MKRLEVKKYLNADSTLLLNNKSLLTSNLLPLLLISL